MLMIRSVVRRSMRWSKLVQAVALGSITSVVYSGCVGGGASGGGNGIDSRDDHGDGPANATVIIPDGANIVGQINFPQTTERDADVDWFRFQGIEGIVYTLQISGFPPDPDVDIDLDLTGDGDDLLVPQILVFNGVTQLVNSSGTQGGEPVDVPVAGSDEDELNDVGDSRIVFAAPLTNTYFIRIAHRRDLTGIGAYELRLASSQLSEILEDDAMFQTGSRFVSLTTDADGNFFADTVAGGVFFDFFEIQESLDTVLYGLVYGWDPFIFFPNEEDPSDGLIHLHAGHPNNFLPEESINTTLPPAAHPNIIEIGVETILVPTGGGRTSTGTLTLSDGSKARFPVEVLSSEPTTLPNGIPGTRARMALHLGDAIDERGETVDVGEEEFRRIIGFPWYMDLHPQDDMTLDSLPVATSRPYGGLYQIFETTFEVDPGNVAGDEGSTSADRGLPLFNIFYDSSLKLFQVATQEYQIFGPPYQGFILNPDYESFVGDRVRVREGQPGESGPVIIDLGTLPAIQSPPTALVPFIDITVREEPGFRAPIRQLTDSEAEDLRDAFYDPERGFYVEVSDAVTGQRLARAEGNDLEISFFDSGARCSFPPCTEEQDVASGPTAKGTVTFASGLPNGVTLELFANGKELGALAEPVNSNDLPACGLTGDNRTLAAEFWPETYYWRAYGSDGKTYEGHVTVTPHGCQLVVISPEDAGE